MQNIDAQCTCNITIYAFNLTSVKLGQLLDYTVVCLDF